MTVRRLHMFAGLLMWPWVLLYGVTAFLYNHPNAFADRPLRHFGASEVAGTAVQTLPSADEVARRVVARLNDGGAPYSLRNDEPPAYTREYIFATVKGDGVMHNVLLTLDGTGGTLRTRPLKPSPAAPFAKANGLDADAPLADKARLAIPAILQRVGAAPGEVTVTSTPEVSFLMDGDGRTWRVTYTPMTGAVAGQPADETAPLSPRQFLTRLHGSHGYPFRTDSRFGWAILVDVMAGVMIFWAASGLYLWWQARGLRLAGVATLAISAFVASVLAFGMWGAIRRFG